MMISAPKYRNKIEIDNGKEDREKDTLSLSLQETNNQQKQNKEKSERTDL